MNRRQVESLSVHQLLSDAQDGDAVTLRAGIYPRLKIAESGKYESSQTQN
jgi:hypothetical protein